MLPLFRRLEDHFLGESEHHGTGGGWRIEAPRLSWAILDAVGDAAEEMGIKRIADFNTGDNEGTSYFHVNQKRGRRWSSARGFLKPVLNRGNLRLEKNVLVDRLIIENGRAVGVRFMQGGEVVEARTKGEVILCAGSIGSTQVLHRSGIGPADWLSPLGIDVVLDKPGVGRNLQDHLQQRAIYKVEGVRTLNETYYQSDPARHDGARLRLPPPRAADHGAVAARHLHPLRSASRARQHPVPRAAAVARQVRRSPASFSRDHRQRLQSAADLARHRAHPLRKTRRGAVDRAELSLDRRRPPGRRRRHPHHAAADEAEAARTISPGQEYLPGPSVGDDDASLAKAAGDIGTTIFHPVGTAKMGTASDPMAVVDERLRFYGIAGLRVADASVMPTITSGNTNTPTAMIAEKGAAMILEDAK